MDRLVFSLVTNFTSELVQLRTDLEGGRRSGYAVGQARSSSIQFSLPRTVDTLDYVDDIRNFSPIELADMQIGDL